MGFILLIVILMLLIQFKQRRRARKISLNPLLGYTLAESFFVGESIPVYIHAEIPCTGTLCRLSNSLENVGDQFDNYVNNQSPRFHPTRGFEWKDPVSISTDNLKPGYYYLKLSASDGCPKTAYVPFILKSREPREITIVSSTNTWHAYNNFGGKSNYVDRRWGLLERAIEFTFYVANYVTRGLIPSWPVYLPLARPFSWIDEIDNISDPNSSAPFSHLLRSEWILAAFLDANGCDYSVISDRDFQNISGYSDTKLVIFNTHSEYWSQEMLARFEALQRRGGTNFFFASGNNAFRMIEYYDQGLAVTNQFSDVATITRLFGAYYTKAGYLGSAPYRIEAPDHWLFEGTNLKAGEAIGDTSIWTLDGIPFAGASGYETDKIFPSSISSPTVLAVGANISGPAYWVIQESNHHFTINVGSVAFMGSLGVDLTLQHILLTTIRRSNCVIREV